MGVPHDEGISTPHTTTHVLDMVAHNVRDAGSIGDAAKQAAQQMMGTKNIEDTAERSG